MVWKRSGWNVSRCEGQNCCLRNITFIHGPHKKKRTPPSREKKRRTKKKKTPNHKKKPHQTKKNCTKQKKKNETNKKKPKQTKNTETNKKHRNKQKNTETNMFAVFLLCVLRATFVHARTRQWAVRTHGCMDARPADQVDHPDTTLHVPVRPPLPPLQILHHHRHLCFQED